MKKDLKKKMIKKAIDALQSQALRDQEIKKLKGGITIGTHGTTYGMFPD